MVYGARGQRSTAMLRASVILCLFLASCGPVIRLQGVDVDAREKVNEMIVVLDNHEARLQALEADKEVHP